MRTVVLLTEHRSSGSTGFVLNRQYHYTLDELLPEAAGLKLPVYFGGPVQVNSIHFLHNYPAEISGSVEVMRDIYWGGDFDAVVKLLKDGIIDPKRIRFYIGYSGWSDGQLAGEIEDKTWLTAEAVKHLVFHSNAEELWRDSIKHLGGEYEIMKNFPIDPLLN